MIEVHKVPIVAPEFEGKFAGDGSQLTNLPSPPPSGLDWQSVTVTLTAAQIAAMNGTPHNVVPAPGANQIIVVHQAVVEANVAEAFSGGGTAYLVYSGQNQVAAQGTISAGLLVNPGDYVGCLGPLAGTGFLPFSAPAGLGVDITNSNAAFTPGNGTLVVTVWYSVVTLAG